MLAGNLNCMTNGMIFILPLSNFHLYMYIATSQYHLRIHLSLIRYARPCYVYDQVLSRCRLLTDKLMLHGFLQYRLMSAFCKSYARYNNLIFYWASWCLPFFLLIFRPCLPFWEDSALPVPRTLRYVIYIFTDYPNPGYLVTVYPNPCIYSERSEPARSAGLHCELEWQKRAK
jgi:hypothetical protein